MFYILLIILFFNFVLISYLLYSIIKDDTFNSLINKNDFIS